MVRAAPKERVSALLGGWGMAFRAQRRRLLEGGTSETVRSDLSTAIGVGFDHDSRTGSKGRSTHVQ